MKGSIFAAAAMVASAFAGPTGVEKRQNTVSNSNTPPIHVEGNAFMNAKNERFYIRGIAYQPGGASANEDPLADTSVCSRDIEEFKKLGVNVIRVYSVDNSKNHDDCMKALADAGIYLALDVNTPFYSLNRLDNESIHMSYNHVYLQSVFATIDEFVKYDNTLLFYSANEVINDDTNTFAAPYIKAVGRDMKAYMAARNYRMVPVGYSAADVESNRFETATYMNCGADSVRSDFFGFNDYAWCAPSSFKTSGWDQKVEQYKDYSIPIFLSEFGCVTNTRDFGEIDALMSDQMTPVYSGGIVYEYTMEDAGYGVVSLNGNSVEELDDFSVLQAKMSSTSAPSGNGGASSGKAPSQCPPQGEHWVNDDPTGNFLPIMPKGAEKFMKDGAGSGPGNDGNTGSQTAAGASTGWAYSDGKAPTSSNNGGSGSSSGAAVANVKIPEMTIAPFVAGAVVVLSSMFGGASLLF